MIANFISGILLVFEQTLRPGDVVEVGGQRGTVSQMRMRATVLRNVDNVEIFVPNKTLLTSTVAAYTFSDRVVRRVISVGVSYDSNPTQVRDILLDVAKSHGLVMTDPAPAVFFTAFGESSLNFDLAVWISDSARALEVVSDLHFAIFSQFTKHDIEIPFPQRDLRLRSVDATLPVHFRKSDGNGPPPPADSKLPCRMSHPSSPTKRRIRNGVRRQETPRRRKHIFRRSLLCGINLFCYYRLGH